MPIQFTSVGSLCQLLNALTKTLSTNGPVAVALEAVAQHFDAELVALTVSHSGREEQIYFGWGDLAADETDRHLDAQMMLADPHAVLSDMFERDQHLTVERHGDGASGYTLSIFRARGNQAFTQEQHDVADVLLSQLTGALELASRMDSSAIERNLYSDALDKLNVGVILVDPTGRVASASTVAERFLDARNGLQLFGSRLRASSSNEDKDLQAAIRAAGQPEGSPRLSRGLSITKRCGSRTLGLMVRPAPATSGNGARLVAIYVRDCELVPDVEGEFVRQIFDLTPAEAAVTRRLTAGLSLEDAATSLAISRNTARAHLRSIFSKSGITRQTELVRLVLNSAALLGDRSPRSA